MDHANPTPSPHPSQISRLSRRLLLCSRQISDSSISQVALVVQNPPINAGDVRGVGSVPRSGGSPGGGCGRPLQRSCLENPMDRGAWWATVHGVSKSQTCLRDLDPAPAPNKGANSTFALTRNCTSGSLTSGNENLQFT